MRISESIEAHLSAAVESISQRNQETLPGHFVGLPSFLSIIIFLPMAKAFGFCLFLYTTGAAGKFHFGKVHFDKLNELMNFFTIATRAI